MISSQALPNSQISKSLIWSIRGVPKPIGCTIATLLGSDVAYRLPQSTYLGHPFGVVIQRKAVIGADSVVIRDVAANTVIADNPARVLRRSPSSEVESQ